MGQGTSNPDKEAAKAANPPIFPPKRGFSQCENCSRNFAPDRIETHMNICSKAIKKRKPFDMSKARVEGTEAASYVDSTQGKRKKRVYLINLRGQLTF